MCGIVDAVAQKNEIQILGLGVTKPAKYLALGASSTAAAATTTTMTRTRTPAQQQQWLGLRAAVLLN